MIQSGVPVCDD